MVHSLCHVILSNSQTNEILNILPTCLCDVTLSVYPHRAGLKNMPGHGGIRTYDLWNTSQIYTQSNITQASYSPEYITPTQQIS